MSLDRRCGRTLALSSLYALDVKRFEDDGCLLLVDDEVPEADAETRAFADELVAGLQAERPAVDGVLDGSLTNWTLPRLAAVDRNILRLGCYEILYRAEVPPKVAITEAIELAKCYGSDDRTAKLVNGVLDRIARQHRGEEIAARGRTG